ncbi:hypothetical protein F4775DRAFT_603641 [Biscogniauxia sp. FL1348]|nr:hypothetical protein F4775DRAFT_603641 [Biscogniauxia sp. FL1348]
MEEASAKYDLLLLTDATWSMQRYLAALRVSIPRIIAVSALTASFSRIGVLAYRDYTSKEKTEWSGWYGEDGDVSQDELYQFTRDLRPDHGNDWPEATKTGFAKAHSVMRSDAKTIVILYTDASPHMPWNTYINREREQDFLSSGGYGESSPLFVDWVSTVRTLQKGEKQAQVFAVIGSGDVDICTPYMFMCHETQGSCFEVDSPSSSHISALTMSIILAWLGVHKSGASSNLQVKLKEYQDTSEIDHVKDEADPTARPYFLSYDDTALRATVSQNIITRWVHEEELRVCINPRATPVQDFSKRYLTDERYRAVAVEHLGKIIEEDVSSMAINPVFGSLWRAVCNDRTNGSRDALITQFGSSVERIHDEEERCKMKVWLEESYDYKAEINSMISEVAQEDRYPCVFLDPTEDWSAPRDEEDDTSHDDQAGRPITSFTRDELLEIGRSCDYRILRRLGRVLTRLTYVASEDALPAHIKAMAEGETPQVPLALAQEKYKQQFWKILLHVVLPGTKLAARPAALLAALSIKMGMQPLMAVADAEMINWSKQWNNLDVPETWNTSCFSLILDADRSFETRRRAGEIHSDIPQDASFLSSDDRGLFERLVDYSMLKANMSTTIQARISWQPEKTKVPIGPLVTCHSCKYPRSVTVMAEGHICGICSCAENEFTEPATKQQVTHLNVSQDTTESTEATWVECAISTCRAQYIVYDTASLNVRPKCHYCRQEGKSPKSEGKPKAAPCVECTKCLSHIIWPPEYRPSAFSAAAFQCPACTSGRETIIAVDTTPAALAQENGTSWLLRNTSDKIPDPFGARSLFKTITAAGLADFTSKVEVLPPTTTTPLTHRGKPIRNVSAIQAALRHWISSRRAEAGTCSLCFAQLAKRALLGSACGRAGCRQPICAGCRGAWYGLNGRGRAINVAALSCPFCRRRPAARAVSGAAVALLGGLRAAVEEAGAWVYAWCDDCGLARRFAERVCAQGAPVPELRRWRCDECRAGGDVVAAAAAEMRIKDCPGCGTPTEKLGGCDHIQCVVPGCGAHWCFFCGLKVSEEEIYVHMSEEHGGWYGGLEAEEYESDIEEDY